MSVVQKRDGLTEEQHVVDGLLITQGLHPYKLERSVGDLYRCAQVGICCFSIEGRQYGLNCEGGVLQRLLLGS